MSSQLVEIRVVAEPQRERGLERKQVAKKRYG